MSFFSPEKSRPRLPTKKRVRWIAALLQVPATYTLRYYVEFWLSSVAPAVHCCRCRRTTHDCACSQFPLLQGLQYRKSLVANLLEHAAG